MTVIFAVDVGTILLIVYVACGVAFGVLGLLLLWAPITRVRQRRRRFGGAAREAKLADDLAFSAQDDPLFRLERIRDDARWLVAAIEDAWTNGDEARLDELLGADLREEWRAAHTRGDRFELEEPPVCHVVDFTDADRDEEDRAVVHLDMQVFAEQGRENRYGGIDEGRTTYTRIGELWTLGKRDGGWILLGIEPDDAAPAADVQATFSSPRRWWGERGRGTKVLLVLAYLGAMAALLLPAVAPDAVDEHEEHSYLFEVGLWALLLVLAVPALWLIIMLGVWGYGATRRSAHQRAQRAGGAIAAAEDPMFDPQLIVERTRVLARDVREAHGHRKPEMLRALVGPRLLAAWTRQFEVIDRRGEAGDEDDEDDEDDDKGYMQFDPRPAIELVRVINRDDHRRDRAVVSVRWRQPYWSMREYWTLGKRDGDWILLGVEQAREGAHHAMASWILTPEDDPELADAARAELAAGDAVPTDALAGLADPDFAADARAAALDLALVDDRFSPDVLAIAARRAVAAWVDAIDGESAELERIAEPAAAEALLHGTDTKRRTRRVVRGPQIEALRIAALDDDAVPPIMELQVDIFAIRYREDLDTAVLVDGSQRKPERWTERWSFALGEDPDLAWRLVETG